MGWFIFFVVVAAIVAIQVMARQQTSVLVAMPPEDVKDRFLRFFSGRTLDVDTQGHEWTAKSKIKMSRAPTLSVTATPVAGGTEVNIWMSAFVKNGVGIIPNAMWVLRKRMAFAKSLS